MSNKRLVHDILSERGALPGGGVGQRRPVAFIQHGNPEDGFTYEGVCPWCGETLGYVPKASITAVIGGLYRVLLQIQKLHWQTCDAVKKGVKEFAVEITQVPLNVEKPFQVQ